MDKTTQIVFIVFTALVALSLLIQAGAALAMFLAVRKAQKKIHALSEDLRIHVLPALSVSRGAIEDLSPKLKVISANLVESSKKVLAMAEDIGSVVGDVATRTRAQAAHVDSMVQGTLDQITQANRTIQHGISLPLRQLNGIVSGLRAGWNVLSQRSSSNYRERERERESDLFG